MTLPPPIPSSFTGETVPGRERQAQRWKRASDVDGTSVVPGWSEDGGLGTD